MSIEEASEAVGKFGKIETKLRGFPMVNYGWVRDYDKKNIEFTDNHDHIFILKLKECKFTPMKFKDKTK